MRWLTAIVITVASAAPAAAGVLPVSSKAWGGKADDGAAAVAALPDGGCLVAGWTRSYGAGKSDGWLIRLDAKGAKAWDRVVGGTGDDAFRGVAATADGGCVVTGETTTPAGHKDLWVLRFSAAGDVEWEKSYGGQGDDGGAGIAALPDGGYAIAAWTYSYLTKSRDLWALKVDAAGELAWSRTMGGLDDDDGAAAAAAPDGSFVVAGSTVHYATKSRDAWVLKFDARGELVFSRAFGGTKDDAASCLAPTRAGAWLVGGWTKSKGVGGRDMWLAKLGADGEKLWDKTLGEAGDDECTAVWETTAGGYALAGTARSPVTGRAACWLALLTGDGEELWIKAVSGKAHDEARAGAPNANGDYLLAGETTSFGAGGRDALVLRLADDGKLAMGRTWAGPGSDGIAIAVAVRDGGYLLAGRRNAGGTSALLIRLNSAGKRVWERTYGGNAVADAIVDLGDGCLVAGRSAPAGSADYRVHLLRLDETGKVLWEKRLPGNPRDRIAAALAGADGEMILAGSRHDGAYASNDGWFLRLSATGDVLADTRFGDRRDEVFHAIAAHPDGGYVVAGSRYLDRVRGTDGWVAKLDRSGRVEWESAAGGPANEEFRTVAVGAGRQILCAGARRDEGTGGGPHAWCAGFLPGGERAWSRDWKTGAAERVLSAASLPDGGWLVGGELSTAGGERDLFVLRLRADGARAWERVFGGPLDERLATVLPLKDGGALVYGTSTSWGAGAAAAWGVKLNQLGEVILGDGF